MAHSKPVLLSKLLAMIGKELFCSGSFERCPEPSLAMEERNSVKAFDEQGSSSLLPIYYFNALATSGLLPRGGTVVDLGAGSGRYLSFLARCRPDAQIIGVDLSEPMLELGRKRITEEKLDARIRLVAGDMTCFKDWIPEKVDVLSSVFSLHHLLSRSDLIKTLQEVKQTRKQTGCAVWVFDHARPRHRSTASCFPEVFTPDASEAFRRDSSNSLLASFSFSELSRALDGVLGERVHHAWARILRLYQAHWLEGTSSFSEGMESLWREPEMSAPHRKVFRSLQWIFKDVSWVQSG